MRKGFTLVEILIAIAVFSILASFMLINFRKDQNYRDLKQDGIFIESIIKKSQTLSLSGQSINGQAYEKFIVSAGNCIAGLCSSFDLKGRIGTEEYLLESVTFSKSKIAGIDQNFKIEFDTPRAQAKITYNNQNVATSSLRLINTKDSSLFKCVEFSAISGRIDITNCQ